jgi:hypothetical protein
MASEAVSRNQRKRQMKNDSKTEGTDAIPSSDLLGRVAYDAYSTAVGGKAWNGDKLPTWAEMSADSKKEKLVTAWKAAGCAVAHYTSLMAINEIVKSGNAGVMPNGNIVDRRIHPEAVAIPRNEMLGVPEPKRPNDPKLSHADGRAAPQSR